MSSDDMADVRATLDGWSDEMTAEVSVDGGAVAVSVGALRRALAAEGAAEVLRREVVALRQSLRGVGDQAREAIDRADAAELAADALRRELADARAECERLGAIVEGSTTPPTRVSLPVAAPAYEHPGCHSDDDGDCVWVECPQLRDNEPRATGRHCPRDLRGDE